VSNALPESTLAWLQEAAAVGIAEPMVLCHLLERVEALEADSFCNEAIVRRLEALERRPISGSVELAALPSEAAPVATDRQHGAAQPPVAPPAPEPAAEPRNPTMDEVLDLAKSLGLEVNDCDALLWLVVTSIAAWGDASAAPWADGPATPGTTPAAITLADRLALAVCVAVMPGAKPCQAPCNACRVNSAAVAHEIARQLRERYGSSITADWLDGVGTHP